MNIGDELPELYNLETVEQMRAIADELRQRIFLALVEEPMTVTQVGERLDVAPAKVHYHVRELQRVGLLRLVATREKGGILEKYYQPVARGINVPRSLLASMSPDETVATMSEYLQEIQRGFMRAITSNPEDDDHPRNVALSRSHFWLTDDEYPAVIRGIEKALEPYGRPRGIEGERELTFVNIMYDTRDALEDGEEHSAATFVGFGRQDPVRKPRRTIVAGSLQLDRDFFEKYLSEGDTADITVIGLVSIASDVPASLVDAVVSRFRHKGVLRAPSAVREVLRRKAAESAGQDI